MSAPRWGHFWPQGNNLNNLGRGPLGEAMYQISKAKAFWFQIRRFLKVSSSWWGNWGYLEQHQDWTAQDNWGGVWHNSAPTVGVVKPGGGINMWKRPLLPSWKLSKPGRLVKALGHHNAMPDTQYTMLIKKLTRRSSRILTPSLQKSTALLTSLEERTLMLLVTNQWRMMQERCQWAKTQSRRPS